jgi:probable phosphoglycerate mutase
MHLYLIRHAKTDSHLKNIRQSPDSPLGEYGISQAKALAKSLVGVKFDHLYSSTWPRAIQTAKEISKELGIKIKKHPHIHENLKHPALNDVNLENEINQRFMKERSQNWNNFDWKFQGEGESVNDLIKRGEKVIKSLVKKHPNDSVCLVSHSYFMAIVTSILIIGPLSDKNIFMRLVRNLEVTNTGVTKFISDPLTSSWRLLFYNDHHHLTQPPKP